MRFTANFPRAAIEKGIPFSTDNNTWLISIADIDAAPARVANNFGRILFVHFNDVEHDQFGPITDGIADKIAQFIVEARNAEASVFVNCHAGICRSGAVVEVLKDLGWTVADYYSPQRIPNLRVFTMIRKRFPELLNSWEI